MSITADHNHMGLRTFAKPLCVDLDGTLIRTDLLHEAVLKLLHINMLYLFMLPIWLGGGKANLKTEIAKRVMPAAQRLLFNEALLDWLQSQRDAGRELVLATASNQRYARAVADHLQIFHFDNVPAACTANPASSLMNSSFACTASNTAHGLQLLPFSPSLITAAGDRRGRDWHSSQSNRLQTLRAIQQ